MGMTSNQLLGELCLDLDKIALVRNWGIDTTPTNQTFLYSSIDVCLVINRNGFTRYEKAIHKLNQTTYNNLSQISWFKERLFTAEELSKMESKICDDLFRQCTDDMLLIAIRKCLGEKYNEYQGVNVRITSGGKQNKNYVL